METVVYKSLNIYLGMIGFGIKDFFFVHIIAITIGHLNHANLNLDYGPLVLGAKQPKNAHLAPCPANTQFTSFRCKLWVELKSLGLPL